MRYINEAFSTNWVAPVGPNIDAFERELCSYIGINYGLALSSGTAGIHLGLRLLGVVPGDYVFCSSLTFSGSCSPILYQYACPVFIDSEEGSWNMSPDALEKAFDWARKENKMPRAVIVVDIYGQSADYDRLLSLCRYYKTPVIEDAAEALGGTYRGRKCGTFGDIGVFSFNGNKIITTSGGGMVVSNSERDINKMRFWATQSREPARHYEHKEIGYNYRMSNVCAGIGRGQFTTLDDRIITRKKIYMRYREEFADLPVNLMPVFSKGSPNYWLSVITVDKDCGVAPEEIFIALEEENIESRPVWKPMHMQSLYKDLPFFTSSEKGSFSEELFKQGICLPSGTGMSEPDQARVIEVIKKKFGASPGQSSVISTP